VVLSDAGKIAGGFSTGSSGCSGVWNWNQWAGSYNGKLETDAIMVTVKRAYLAY